MDATLQEQEEPLSSDPQPDSAPPPVDVAPPPLHIEVTSSGPELAAMQAADLAGQGAIVGGPIVGGQGAIVGGALGDWR